MILPTALVQHLQVVDALKQIGLAIAEKTAMQLQDTVTTQRKTLSYGYDYFALTMGDKAFRPIPHYLTELCQACIDAFPPHFNLGQKEDYTNVIVSIYEAGYQLQAHADAARGDIISNGQPIDFYFGENVLGIILEADAQGRLYILKAEQEGHPPQGEVLFQLEEKPGLVYLLSGQLRHKPYYHGVSQVEKRRISVTFRTVNL